MPFDPSSTEDYQMADQPKVLIIEDNDALRAMLFTILRYQPVGVDTAATAAEALEKVLACDYALILIDMNLPERASGFVPPRFRGTAAGGDLVRHRRLRPARGNHDRPALRRGGPQQAAGDRYAGRSRARMRIPRAAARGAAALSFVRKRDTDAPRPHVLPVELIRAPLRDQY